MAEGDADGGTGGEFPPRPGGRPPCEGCGGGVWAQGPGGRVAVAAGRPFACPVCGAVRAVTVGDVRAALAGVPDDALVVRWQGSVPGGAVAVRRVWPGAAFVHIYGHRSDVYVTPDRSPYGGLSPEDLVALEVRCGAAVPVVYIG